MKFIQYNLVGKVVKKYSTDVSQWETYPLGEKVRITTKLGKEYIGFWNTFIMNNQLPAEIKVVRYDFDEETGKLRSDKEFVDYVPIKEITKLEAILHSSPRWGTRATNKFVFASQQNLICNQVHLKIGREKIRCNAISSPLGNEIAKSHLPPKNISDIMLHKIGVFKEMMGMKKIQKLHDDIKDKYEKRDCDQQIESTSTYSNPDKLNWCCYKTKRKDQSRRYHRLSQYLS